jgi:hypothetical protein
VLSHSARAINRAHRVNTVSSASPQHLKERPAKRARAGPAKAGNSARVAFPKRGRGCLSELPAVPLDILFEVGGLRCPVIEAASEPRTLKIFGHLHPSSLLSLSRVNKAFRSLLLSRGSSFLWNACFKLCGAPTSPVDMSPPAWAHLLFGGAYCYVSNLGSNVLSTIEILTSRSRVVARSQ